MSFTDQVLESTAPWADPNGFWATYNAAIASAFEAVFGIVSDSGDPEQTVVAILSAPLSTAAAVASLPIAYLSEPVSAGTTITLAYSQSVQSFTTTADGRLGASSLAIESTIPNYPYPAATPVQLGYEPGWSSLLDPLNCPDKFLPFLAQFNGTIVPVGLDPTTARTKITAESAQQRGTLGAIESAVQRNLRGTQFVVVLERTDSLGVNPYWFFVIVRPEEVIDVTALMADVNATKPGGVQWTLIQTDGWTIGQMEAQYPTIAALEAAFTTINGLENDQPGH